MWPKKYRDYPPDSFLIKNRVGPGKGIIGCEMHEINGWGTSYHVTPEQWKVMSTVEMKSLKNKGK